MPQKTAGIELAAATAMSEQSLISAPQVDTDTILAEHIQKSRFTHSSKHKKPSRRLAFYFMATGVEPCPAHVYTRDQKLILCCFSLVCKGLCVITIKRYELKFTMFTKFTRVVPLAHSYPTTCQMIGTMYQWA